MAARDLEVLAFPPARPHPLREAREHGVVEILARAEAMEADAVGDLAGQAQRMRFHRGDGPRHHGAGPGSVG
jgi:hypothetical protein